MLWSCLGVAIYEHYSKVKYNKQYYVIKVMSNIGESCQTHHSGLMKIISFDTKQDWLYIELFNIENDCFLLCHVTKNTEIQ